VSLLDARNLTLSVGGVPILRDVALNVRPGEILGLVGESGSGKSMTALSILQLLPQGAALSGSVKLEGRELIGRGEAELCEIRGREIGMVFQEPMTALNPVRTIGDQVAETVLVHRKTGRDTARDIARQTLARVGLDAANHPLDRYPHQLSGGQRQRVVIAMAIALRPSLLIADEPTTALDVTTQAQILALLRRLVSEDGMGLIFITHDLALVAEAAHRMAVMRAGEIVESGLTLDVFRRMNHPYTRALFEASRHVPRRPERRSDRKDTPVLEARDITRDYVLPRRTLFAPQKSFRAVDGVSFTIGRGENVGLVGESGSGKSTLGRTVLALDAPQSGTIRLDGERVGRDAAGRTARRKMQVVFQDPYGSFNPRHRVERLVGEPFHLLPDPPVGKERRRRIAEALSDVGLSPQDAEKYIHEFSGGQRQRIAIARALIIRPALIVLDEAVSSLDVSIRAQILDLLSDLSERYGISYLFIAHDLNVVRAITDRVLVMKAGRIVEEGETEAVFNNPKHPYTQELLAAAPNLNKALAARAAETAR
jgi:peptide/nickel transport system ATP-binding protein